MKKEEKIVYNTIAEEEPYCMLCGKPYNLHLHHIRYGMVGRHTYFGNIIRLCINCHQMVHSNKRKWQHILIELADKHEKEMNRVE
jgi:predicted HNH restriction endonuclease